MAKRPCLDCSAPATSTRCPACARHRDAARGRRQARGYDTSYDRERRDLQRRMDAGELFTCWRCAEKGRPHHVDPASWHLGHDDADRTILRGPECPPGNLATSYASHM